MKIPILTILLFFFFIKAYCQETMDKITLEVCECVDPRDPNIMKNGITNCIDRIFEDYREDLISETSIEDETELYNTMIRHVQPLLIENCENVKVLFNKINKAKQDERSISMDDCINYKYGKYYLVDDTIISQQKRRKKVEVSYDLNGKFTGKSKIYWINDCDYLLIFNESDKDGFYSKGDTLYNKLIHINKDTLYYKATYKGFVFNYKYKMIGK